MPAEQRMRLERGYGRVDRRQLKALLRSPKVNVIRESVNAEVLSRNIYTAGGVKHDSTSTTLTLSSGKSLRAKLVVDASGFESHLTIREFAPGEAPAPMPGFQIAYGFECIVD